MLQNRGIAFKLCFYILLVTVIIFMLSFYYNYSSFKKLFFEEAEYSAKSIALSVATKINNVFTASEKIAQVTTNVLEKTNYTKKQLRGLLDTIVSENAEIYGSCVAFEPNIFKKGLKRFAPYVCDNGNGSTDYIDIANSYDYFQSNWYRIPKELNKPYWTEPYYDKDAGNVIMTTYSVPFYKKINSKKVFTGITTVDISLEWLRKYLLKINFCKGGFVFIISQKGVFISHPDKSLIMNETCFSIAKKKKNKSLEELGDRMISGNTGYMMFYDQTKNEKGIIFYTPLQNHWSIGVYYPEDEVMSGLHILSSKIIACAAIGIILICLIIILISNRITAPLRKLTEAAGHFGSGNFDIPLPDPKVKDEISRLGKAFILMQEELKKYMTNLKETTAVKERIESELRIAHNIQMSMVPRTFPPFPSQNEFDIYASMIPAKSVGGDLYDFFFIDEKKFCFAIGDVSGKGIPAALLMAVCRTLIRGKAKQNLNVAEIVNSINEELTESNYVGMFITLYLCILNIETGSLEICNAGHKPPYFLRRSGSLQQYQGKHGPAVGLFPDSKFKYDIITLLPNDYIILYTDGITEAYNENNEMYSENRLIKILNNIPHDMSPQNIIKKITEDIHSFVGNAEQSDDMTIEILRFRGSANSSVISNK